MDVLLIKEKLHEYINNADEQQLYMILDFIERGDDDKATFDETTMKMLHQRREDHLNGISTSYSVEESMQLIRQSKK